jgi:pantothenate synthetase
VQVVDEETTTDIDEVTPKAVMAMAVFVGQARLIDNMRLWTDSRQ